MTTAEKLIWQIDLYHQAVNAGIFDHRDIELLEGELIKMSPEGTPHAGAIRDLARFLTFQLGNRAEVSDGHPVTLSETSEPEPDIAIVQPLGKVYRDHHPYPENIFWLIEFSNSSLEQDLGQKQRIYAMAEISEYWVVNLRQQQVHVYRQPQEGEYQISEVVRDGSLTPEAFPDVQVDLRELF
ncbi:MAG: Uma2 family endonuclease [Oscillatoriales cyanobacterium RM2_1_1]|nr:Uma2 family endonuclease [Oscillatoriales cyanobacterium SM2_3_0]NJO45389.1 Uma2 family endonuclease [Oscillatoriales cyanobacterium RM2_1_1]